MITSQLNLTGISCELQAQDEDDLITQRTALAVASTLPKFEFLAGRLSLDFCNSHSRATGRDRLTDAAALAAWAARAGRPLPEVPDTLAYRRFLDLRHVLCRLFDALLDGMEATQADLDSLAAAALPRRTTPLRWDRVAGRAMKGDAAEDTESLYQAIAEDAVALLTGDAAQRIKRCPSDACHWFFLDTSRNGKRRWCAMADCGTKAKVRDYRARLRNDIAF